MNAILYIFRHKSNVHQKYAIAANDIDRAWDKLEEYLEWEPIGSLTVGDCFELLHADIDGVYPL